MNFVKKLWRGMRRVVSVATILLLSIKVAPGLFVTAAAGEALSASAERYATCVEQEATGSARAHVRDPEVLGSAVPKKALSILVNNDLGKTCGPLLDEALRSENGDGGRAVERGDLATKAAIDATLAESPPPPHLPVPGIDDYAHGEKLDNGAWEYLSIECQALLDWIKYAVPASCNQEVLKANRLEKEKYDRSIEHLLETPNVRYCLGLRSLGESGPPPGATGDPFAALIAEGEEDQRKLQAALDDQSGKLDNCLTRIRAAGGLVFIDPSYEMARVNRIPEVKQASDQYAKCTTDRAVEFARVSNEPAETIARAALGGCSVLREQYLAALARGLGIVMTREIAAQEEKETTGALIGHVITARAH
jgi:hypothetical protein